MVRPSSPRLSRPLRCQFLRAGLKPRPFNARLSVGRFFPLLLLYRVVETNWTAKVGAGKGVFAGDFEFVGELGLDMSLEGRWSEPLLARRAFVGIMALRGITLA